MTIHPLILLQAAPAAGPAPSAGDSLMGLLPLVLMFVAFYFFLIAPQRKQQKAIAKFQSELKVGDAVMTNAGIFGKVVSLQDNRATVQVAEGVRLVFLRSAILSPDDTSKAA